MYIELDHPKFSGVELSDQSLIVHSMQTGARVLRENVQDVAVTMHGSQIQIAAFVNADYAWFFSGDEELQSERLELGEPYGGGGRLISDGLGRTHLFYFVAQSPGHSRLLRHHQYAGKWSQPQTVSANVLGEPWAYSVCWHSDHYLHLAYLAHKDQRLLYRVYDLEHGLWSGAVAFSEAPCSYPQFLTAEFLYLFWLEESEQTMLKVRSKSEQWSGPVLLSTGQQHAGLLGFALAGDGWSVLWGEGGAFYQVPLGRWTERQAAERGDFEYVWKVQGGLTLPMYKVPTQRDKAVDAQSQAEKAEEATEERPAAGTRIQHPTPEEERLLTQLLEAEQARRQREAEQARAQAAFMEQAFRTLQEWEQLRKEIRRWRQEWKPAQPVDLSPLTARLERLERRCLGLRQAQEEAKAQVEASRAQLEREVFRLRGRVEELESAQKAKARGFWQRVLGRS